MFHYKCGGRKVTEGCTVERVDLGVTGGQYCKMCYRNADISLPFGKKEKELYLIAHGTQSMPGDNLCRLLGEGV